MRVLTYVLTSLLVIVTSFNIRSLDNSIDNPRHQQIQNLLEQLNELQNPSDASEEQEVSEEKKPLNRDEASTEGDLALSLSSKGLAHFWHQMMSSIRHDVLRQSTTWFQTKYLEMTVDVDAIQTVHFHPPTIHVKTTADGVHLKTEGGHAKVVGLYSGRYRTVREGQMEAVVRDIHIDLDLMRTDDGKITASLEHCSHSLGTVEFVLRPPLPNQISSAMRDEFIQQISNKICPTIVLYANRLIKTTRNSMIIQNPAQQLSVTSPSYKVAEGRVDDQGLLVSYKNDNQPVEEHVRLAKSDADMQIVISQTFINDYIQEIANSGNIVLQLHKIPEIQAYLSTSCESKQCFGHLLPTKDIAEGSGKLTSTCMKAPEVVFQQDEAVVYMKTHQKVSYEMKKRGNMEVVMLEFDMTSQLNIHNLKVEAMEEGRYKWVAEYQLQHFSIDNLQQQLNTKLTKQQVTDLINTRKSEIEQLLSNYIEGNLPVFTNQHMRMKHARTSFQTSQMTMEADFKVSRALFPIFDFSS